MPSASSANPLAIVSVASPPPVPSVAAITSYVESTMDQWMQLLATVQQDISNALNTLGQEIAQEVSSVQQQWDHLLGINPTLPNPSLNTAVTKPSNDSGAGRGNSSGSGSGSGATTTAHNSPNQALNIGTQQSGGGSGSGSSTTTNQIPSGPGGMKANPLTSPSSGSAGSGVAGSGTGSLGHGTGSGYAYVSGRVWLDNNGDGSLDNGEMGYQGITVDLMIPTTTPWTVVQSTTTDANGDYSFAPLLLGPQPEYYAVHVELAGLNATFPGPLNQINNLGNSAPFLLNAGAWRKIAAGLLSMTVTTTQDDSNGPIQNQITLRDAIQTGNNGGGPMGLNKIFFISQGQPLKGTISLQKVLDPISRSYDIIGPGSTTLAVSGANSFQVFNVQATSTISGLTIENGYAQSGGGIFNSGTLTLANDNVVNNSTPNGGNGGGIFNTKGTLNVNSTNVTKNQTAPQGLQGGLGGGLYNVGGGVVKISGSEFYNNRASNGGGIFNASGLVRGSTVDIKNGTTIDYNIVTGGGGGVDNSFGQVSMSGGSIYENSSGIGGGLYTVGGGGGHVSFSHVYLYANFAQTGNGGGVYENAGTLSLAAGTVQGNKANNGNGGGIYFMTGTLILRRDVLIGGGNTAITGGGLYLAGGTTNFSGVTVSGNTATKQAAGVAYTTNATLKPPPPIPAANLTDNDDPGGQPVKV